MSSSIKQESVISQLRIQTILTIGNLTSLGEQAYQEGRFAFYNDIKEMIDLFERHANKILEKNGAPLLGSKKRNLYLIKD